MESVKDKKNLSRNKTKALVFAAAILLSAAAVISAIYLFNEEKPALPQITIENVVISGITPEITAFDITVQINNTNPIGAVVSDLNFDIIWRYNEQNYIIGSGFKDKIEVGADDNFLAVIPVEIDNENLVPLAAAFMTDDYFDISVKGDCNVQVSVLSVNVPFNEHRTIKNELKPKINDILGDIKTVLFTLF
ncbi:MAG: hypothetical protein JXQ82_08775 [Methanomicrobiaceae archaeon]|nr:hypothetical protein [Methanomicrobiaceae archaeon]